VHSFANVDEFKEKTDISILQMGMPALSVMANVQQLKNIS